jgi:hypothetical protein
MGLVDRLKGLFGKTEPEMPPNAGVGYGDFTTPMTRYPIISAHYNGLDGWAPRVGIELPPVRNQDELLSHYDREKPNEANPNVGPTPFWAQRNRSLRLRADTYETWYPGTLSTMGKWPNGQDSWPVNDPAHAIQETARRDVKEIPVMPSRPTAFMSPSNFRFEHKMRSGRGDIQHLSGAHFSMASMHRNFGVGGMQPARRFRNTYRLEPAPRDAASYDEVPDNVVPNGTVQSPNTVGAPNRNRSYRL